MLGVEPYITYDKYRTTYEIDHAEIVLDEMPYGNFTEIEGDIQTIESLVAKLGLEDTTRLSDSYTVIFEHVKWHLGIDFDDLTFDNFDGIDVPEKALYPRKL